MLPSCCKAKDSRAVAEQSPLYLIEDWHVMVALDLCESIQDTRFSWDDYTIHKLLWIVFFEKWYGRAS